MPRHGALSVLECSVDAMASALLDMAQHLSRAAQPSAIAPPASSCCSWPRGHPLGLEGFPHLSGALTGFNVLGNQIIGLSVRLHGVARTQQD